MVTYNPTQFAIDESKERSREAILDFCARSLPNSLRRRRLSAAFLTGPSLVEWEQVYRPLGLRARNVHGIERDVEAYDLAHAENQALPPRKRIHLNHTDALDFFAGPERYDIVSLDFVQNYGPDLIRALDVLFTPGNSSLSKDSVLLVNTQARREGKKYQRRLALLNGFFPLFLEGVISSSDYYYRGIDPKKYGDFRETYKFALEILKHTLEDRELIKLRKAMGHNDFPDPTLDLAFPIADLRAVLFQEIMFRAHFPLLRCLSLDNIAETLDTAQRERDHIEGIKNDLFYFKDKTSYLKLDPNKKDLTDSLDLALAGLAGGIGVLYLTAGKLVRRTPSLSIPPEVFKTFSQIPDSQVGKMAHMLNLEMGHRIRSYDTYRYNSASGTPMLMHMFHLRNPKADKDVQRQSRELEVLMNQKSLAESKSILMRYQWNGPRLSHADLIWARKFSRAQRNHLAAQGNFTLDEREALNTYHEIMPMPNVENLRKAAELYGKRHQELTKEIDELETQREAQDIELDSEEISELVIAEKTSISKEDAVELLRDGFDISMILEDHDLDWEFRGNPSYVLRGLRAAITKGNI